MKIFRLSFLFPLCLLVSLGQAFAQSYPNKVIRVVSTSPAGGALDIAIRPVMEALAIRLGQPVIIDNRGGANGAIATGEVARATPDGYTLLATYLAPVAINPAMRSGWKFDSVKDFAPVTQLTSAPLVIISRPGLPIKTIPELVAYAKSHPGALTFGSVGIGSAGHLLGTMLDSAAGIKMVHVPYKGAAPLVTDLLGGQIDLAFVGLAGGISYIKAGRTQAVAVSTVTRTPLLPGVPAIAETYPGIDVNSWYGVMAPAGTPAAIVNRLQQEFAAIVKQPSIASLFVANGLEAKASTPHEFAERINQELPKWAAAVKAADVIEK